MGNAGRGVCPQAPWHPEQVQTLELRDVRVSPEIIAKFPELLECFFVGMRSLEGARLGNSIKKGPP